MNSITKPIEESKKSSIVEIVGEKNIIDNGDIIAFSLPNSGYFTPNYRSERKKEIDALDRILL